MRKLTSLSQKNMFTGTKGISSKLLALLLLICTALWSAMEMASWILSSVIGDVLAIYEACQSISSKESSQDYNFINYPDEVSSNF